MDPGNIEKSVERAARRAQATEMKKRGYTWTQIAEQLGYATAAVAAQDVLRALEYANRRVREQLDGYRQLEGEKLDALERLMWAIVRKKHILAQQGRIMFDPETGEPMIDQAPLFAAADRLVKIAERRAKLFGWDAPTKLEVRATNELDTDIAGLLAQLAARGEGVPEAAALEEAPGDGADEE
jgi:predicted transcriptional regulator